MKKQIYFNIIFIFCYICSFSIFAGEFSYKESNNTGMGQEDRLNYIEKYLKKIVKLEPMIESGLSKKVMKVNSTLSKKITKNTKSIEALLKRNEHLDSSLKKIAFKLNELSDELDYYKSKTIGLLDEIKTLKAKHSK